MLAGVGLLGVAALPARAQVQPDGSGSPDLNDLALDWVRGEYRAPLVCEIDDRPQRGLRRLMIGPGPRAMRPRANSLRLFDLEVETAKRCFDDLGGEEPNAEGVIHFSLRSRSRPDTARRDFSAALRRDSGFAFDIREGRVRVRRVGEPNAEPRVVDFASGVLRVETVARGSDVERRLLEFGGLRRLTLRLEARDGTTLRYHVIQVAPR
ncbi:MAG: hypothetical protein JSU66_12655 [Deltaproteobacteria bacterium]|nr:MAG: hypothetical protein JSU66_12655 [Deltaproteobacteria bacterium]